MKICKTYDNFLDISFQSPTVEIEMKMSFCASVLHTKKKQSRYP